MMPDELTEWEALLLTWAVIVVVFGSALLIGWILAGRP